MVPLPGNAPRCSDYQSGILLLNYRGKGRVFVPKTLGVPNFVAVLLSRLNIRLVRIAKRRTVSTKIVSNEGFCSGFCPFLNGVWHGARCFRPLACVDMMHSVIALCSLARLAQMHTPNTLTGNGRTS